MTSLLRMSSLFSLARVFAEESGAYPLHEPTAVGPPRAHEMKHVSRVWYTPRRLVSMSRLTWDLCIYTT